MVQEAEVLDVVFKGGIEIGVESNIVPLEY